MCLLSDNTGKSPSFDSLMRGASLILLVCGLTRTAMASDAAAALGLQLDVLHPTKHDRQLQTIDVHAPLAEKRFNWIPLTLQFGVTLSRVTGYITQLEGDFNKGTLHEAALASSAWGAGAVTQQLFEVIHWAGFTLRADLSEGVLWYDHDFPRGGRRYNFMLQTGPTIAYAPPVRCLRLSVGYRWMHVSNGGGLGPWNPSYEAAGPVFGAICALRPES